MSPPTNSGAQIRHARESGHPEPPLVRDGRDRPLQSLLRDKEGGQRFRVAPPRESGDHASLPGMTNELCNEIQRYPPCRGWKSGRD